MLETGGLVYTSSPPLRLRPPLLSPLPIPILASQILAARPARLAAPLRSAISCCEPKQEAWRGVARRGAHIGFVSPVPFYCSRLLSILLKTNFQAGLGCWYPVALH